MFSYLNKRDENLWKIEISGAAKSSRNLLLEVLRTWEFNPQKEILSLSLGDPLAHGNLGPTKETTNAVIETIVNGKHNGYAPSVGYDYARQAVSDYLSQEGINFEAKDIILCSGCSSALDLCITVLGDPNENQNILIPRPGFPLYRVLCESMGIGVRTYDLLPDCNWEIDLFDLETKIDDKTAAIILNNPSNPCGSVYSTKHLKELLEIAYKHKIPIIADEIYAKYILPGNIFTSVGSLSTRLPILICRGLAKDFLVPGWRLGWIAIHDPIDAFVQVRKGLVSLTQRIIGSNTVVQGALSNILQTTPQNFNEGIVTEISKTIEAIRDGVSKIKGLKMFMPQGAIYLLVQIEMEKFPQFTNSLEFTKSLYKEESVFCLPGETFEISGYMRIVTTTPIEVLEEAIKRISIFCHKYYMQ